jgi:hypothetical protein
MLAACEQVKDSRYKVPPAPCPTAEICPAIETDIYSVESGILSRNQFGSFLRKLWQMLSNPAHAHCIAWNFNGTAFSVDKTVLEKDVLNIYFCHKKFASFQRQLR